jgi:Spy/CpxP family protein refolding chaperone
MNKKLVTIAAVVITLALVIAPFAFAQHMRAGRHGDFAGGDLMFLGHLGRAKAALGLSDQQVSDIQAIFTDLKAQNEPYRTSIKGGFHSVVTTLLNNPNDLAAAQAQLDAQEQAEHQMKANALVAASKALNVLTPDQRGKLQQFVNERMARHQQK